MTQKNCLSAASAIAVCACAFLVASQPARSAEPAPSQPARQAAVAPARAGATAVCPPPTGGITGTVTAADTGLPIANAFVWVYAPGGAAPIGAPAFTDAAGRYTKTGLPAGQYQVQVIPSAPASIAPEWYQDASDQAGATAVAVADGAHTPGVDFALETGSRITGRVLAQDTGLGLPGIQVGAWPASGGWTLATGVTDASGYYTTTGLRSGSYYVWFRSQIPSGNAYAYIAEYYDNQWVTQTASLVAVTMPVTRTGVDAVLERGAQIAGTITTEGSGLPVFAQVTAYAVGSAFTAVSGPTSQGHYLTPGLPSGSYKLRFNPISGDSDVYLPEYYNGKASIDTADAIDVTAPGALNGIDAQLARAGSIAGHVYGVWGWPFVLVTAYDIAGSQLKQVSAYLDGGASYLIGGLPTGYYKVRFEDVNCPRFAPQYYNAQGDLASATPVSVTAGTSTTGIDARLWTLRVYVPLNWKP